MQQGLEVVSNALCIVGESPIWIPHTKQIVHVDIRGKRLRKIHMPSGKIQDIILTQMVSFVFEAENGSILGGAEDGIYQVCDDGNLAAVNNCAALKGTRYNDGKVGPDGRLYMGTSGADGTAAFYRMDHDGIIQELFDGVGISNGLTWDEKKNILYYNDSPTGRTDAFDFDTASGTLSNRRPVITYPEGVPDGMTIDTDGNL